MYKPIISSLIFTSLILFNVISAQESNSIQINGGLIFPKSSSKGLTGLVQFNYPLNEQIYLYAYSGYSSWDKYYVVFREDYSEIQKKQLFKTYSADDHTLIPVYIGSTINLNTNDFFTFYVTVEAGYAYLHYNSYDNWKSVDPETGEVLGYFVDGASRKEITENLFGIGVGAGISHPMGDNLNLIFSFKLNSYLNSSYYGFLSTQGTYTMFLAGISFNI
ncbi:hypothetical protein MNBD_IGNAVI01-3040 [hydrothermal vent metagenome]|uniref:Outer membrane protein beta-barrel domain-containing protein n=1 Tax=hydrothermal vent metagenome TaxID=652676 RepID=A0A3B1DK81_9ZZZZ